MDDVQDVVVHGKEGAVERVRGVDGAQDGLEHQHRGDESLERVNEGDNSGKVPDRCVLPVNVCEGEQVRRVVGDDGGCKLLETGGD